MLVKFTSHEHFPNWVHLAGLAANFPGKATPLSVSISLDVPGYLQHLLGKADNDSNQGSVIVSGADKVSVETVELLLGSGADVNQFDVQGYTALHWACVKNHFEAVRAFLREGGDMNTLTRIVPFDVSFPPTQRSAPWYACHHGHEETVSELQVCMESKYAWNPQKTSRRPLRSQSSTNEQISFVVYWKALGWTSGSVHRRQAPLR